MDPNFIALGLGIVLAVAILWVLARLNAGDKSLGLIQNQINNLAESLDRKLGESSKQMQESVRTQFSESQKLIRDITQQITQVKETNKQVSHVADQLKSLQNILQNPKQRGVLGEYYLETVLKNVLPPEHFQMQYGFEDGTIVDAVIRLGSKEDEKLLPIDSKFPMENYNRLVEEKERVQQDKLEKSFAQDLKNRITETAKYIRPAEGTLDFAFMFIPSEAIFHDLLAGSVGTLKNSARNLIEEAFRNNVIIVAPTSFLAYLQTVLQGLRALQIEESAKKIRVRVEELGRHINNYEEYMNKLGKTLGTTVGHYNQAYKELKKIDKDIVKVTGKTAEIEPLKLDKPHLED